MPVDGATSPLEDQLPLEGVTDAGQEFVPYNSTDLAERHKPDVLLRDLAMPRMGGREFRRAQLSDPAVATVPMAIISGAVEEAEG